MMFEIVELYAAVSYTAGGPTPGACLVFSTRAEADAAFDISVTSLTEGRLPPSRFALKEDMGVWQATFEALGVENHLVVDAEGIAAEEVAALRNRFGKVLYFFVIFGWKSSDGTVSLVDPEKCALYKSAIEINGTFESGKRVLPIPWNAVFSGGTHMQLGSWV